MASTSAKYVGPAVLLVGDPTVAVGAGMTNLGDTEQIVFNAGNRMVHTSSAELAGTPEVDGIYALPPRPTVSAQLKEIQQDNLSDLILGGTLQVDAGGDAFGGGNTFQKITEANVPTLCIVPYFEKGDGVNADHAIWLPACYLTGFDGHTFTRPPESGEVNQPYNVEFMGARRALDQTSPTPVSIPAAAQLWFIGPPSAWSLTWFLPSL